MAAAIPRIPERAQVAIKYPNEIWDEAEQRWISGAQVARINCTAINYSRVEA